MSELKTKLRQLIDKAAILGLPDIDITYANDFLTYFEFELCLDHVCTQMYEFTIKIDDAFLALVYDISNLLGLQKNEHKYLEELLTDK